jgi:hypothetical protein
MEFKNSEEIAIYYVYGYSDALTNSQEIKDLTEHIDKHVKKVNSELLELAFLVKRITNRVSMPTEMEVSVLQEQSEKAINKALNQ